MNSRRRTILAAAAGTLLAGAGRATRAHAQSSGRPMRFVVGFAPGGVVDVVTRHVTERLHGTIASSTVVDNRPGAGGRIAVEIVKKAEPDGLTVLSTANPMITLYPHVYRRLSYDPRRDLRPVATLGTFPLVLVAGPGLPRSVTTIDELVRWCLANPKSASYGTSAAGSTLHFIGVMFARAAGIQLTHVAYKGGAPAIQDLLGGQIPMAISTASTVVPHLAGGKLRALAASGTRRSSILPGVPTFVESGYPQIDMSDWLGMFVPSHTSTSVVERLNAAIRLAVKSTETREAFARLIIEAADDTPDECARRIDAESKQWGAVVKASGFVGEES